MVLGIIGDPVSHSLSPHMQNAAIGQMGLDAVYVPFRVAAGEVEAAVRGMRALGIRGLNVTVPHKTAVMPYLDVLTAEARAAGAVNTIVNDYGSLIGDNTDIYGFMACLTKEGGIDPLPEHVCVLGAGGAARAVVYGCAMRPEVRTVTIINRTVSKAERIAADIGAVTGKAIQALPAEYSAFRETFADAGLVVNTTSLGMHPQEDTTPVGDAALFRPGQAVCDIVYTPLRTRFLRDAESRGAKTVSGLSMLAYQGARSLTLWTGREAPADVMLAVLREQLESRR